jgi:glycosyltransferase involved in cell wall biosynthesis
VTLAGPARRILVFAPFPPDPNGLHGGSRVIGQLIEGLARRHEVALLYLRAPRDLPLADTLRPQLALAEEITTLPHRGSIRLAAAVRAASRAGGVLRGRPVWVTDWTVATFRERARAIAHDWRPDVVQAEFHVMGQYLSAGTDAVRVLVEHEPGAPIAAELARTERGLRQIARRLDSLAWRRYERNVLGRPHAVVAFTEEDRAALLALEPSAHVVRIAPGVPLPPEPLDSVGAHPPRVLYLGSFVHPPNTAAACRLARDIFPAVHARRPDALLEVVGGSPPPQIRALERPGVVVVGGVDDVAPYLARAAVVAAPLGLGGGVRIKVLEAFAAGKAVVATPRALAGLDIVPGEHALVATTDQEFSAALVTLLDNPARRTALARAAREWASVHLRWSDAVSRYEALYEELLGTREGAANR